jgi:hypothetical protein
MITEDREMGYIERDNILGFPIVEQLSQTEREFLILHWVSS